MELLGIPRGSYGRHRVRNKSYQQQRPWTTNRLTRADIVLTCSNIDKMATSYDVLRSQMLATRAGQPASLNAIPDACLEPGPMNRLCLSLRSGIPSQVDWALRRLAMYTSEASDKLILTNYPGLAEALADFLRRLFLATHGASRSEWDVMQRPQNLNGLIVDQGTGGDDDGGFAGIAMASVRFTHKPPSPVAATEPFQPFKYIRDAALLRRTLESVLILRNLALSQSNLPSIAQVPHFLNHLYGALVLDTKGVAMEQCADIRINLLDILENLAPHLTLSDWVRRRFVLNTEKDTTPHFVEDRLFVILYDWINTTQDRALLLGSLRCIRAFASNAQNSQVLVEVDMALHPTSLGLVKRCLLLLPLTQDPELLEAVLDLLYQLLTIDDNALMLGLDNVPTHAIVHFLARNLSLGKSVWERDSPMISNQHAWWASLVPNTQRIRQNREWERREKMSPMERQRWKVLPSDIRSQIETLPEPERGTQWMKTLFEYDAQGEVTQMDFWIAYRDQFTPIANAGGAPLQPAANLIRNVSQTFPGAAAMVISGVAGAQSRFVIRGIAPRIRESLAGPSCPWVGCPTPQAHTWANVREHLVSHVAHSSDGLCRCQGCSFAASPNDEASQRAELHLHVRTHLPPVHEQDIIYAPSATPALGTHERPGVITFDVERTPSIPTALAGQPPLPCGIAFLSVLILRYVIRISSIILRRDGYGCPDYTYGGAVASSKQPSERDAMFGFPFVSLTDDIQAQNDSAANMEDRYAQSAIRLMQAATSIEDVLVETSLRNDILCRLANDTLVAIRPVADDNATASKDY